MAKETFCDDCGMTMAGPCSHPRCTKSKNGAVMEVFVVLKNSDMTEGRGPMSLIGHAFTTEEAAIEYCKTQEGVMGVKDDKVSRYENVTIINSHEIRKIQVYENIENTEEYKLNELKKIALSKLSEDEKSVLGL